MTSRFAAAVLAAALPGLAAAQASAQAPADSTLTLAGGRDGTVFRSLTVEGENRIRIEFARPELAVDLDPASAPGLSWGSSRDVLDRTVPDLVGPFLAASADVPSPYTPRPWLAAYAAGPVAVFATDVKGVASWQLLVVDSRGAEVVEFAGEGAPPRLILWDGLDREGHPAAPGLTYSFVLESWDKAGNKRRFTGDGFALPAYRTEGPSGPLFLVSGSQWRQAAREAGGRPSVLALEAASRLNLHTGAAAVVEIRATGRSFAAAEALGDEVAAVLGPLLPGGATRLVVTTAVEDGSPPEGSVLVRLRGS
jgi:hypothetical protein